jgi:hypothetical protein
MYTRGIAVSDKPVAGAPRGDSPNGEEPDSSSHHGDQYQGSFGVPLLDARALWFAAVDGVKAPRFAFLVMVFPL